MAIFRTSLWVVRSEHLTLVPSFSVVEYWRKGLGRECAWSLCGDEVDAGAIPVVAVCAPIKDRGGTRAPVGSPAVHMRPYHHEGRDVGGLEQAD